MLTVHTSEMRLRIRQQDGLHAITTMLLLYRLIDFSQFESLDQFFLIGNRPSLQWFMSSVRKVSGSLSPSTIPFMDRPSVMSVFKLSGPRSHRIGEHRCRLFRSEIPAPPDALQLRSFSSFSSLEGLSQFQAERPWGLYKGVLIARLQRCFYVRADVSFIGRVADEGRYAKTVLEIQPQIGI